MDKTTLNAIIRPLPDCKWACDYNFASIERGLEGFSDGHGLDLEPDFQRGHVWTKEQQTRFIEGVFRGTVPSSLLCITFNSAYWESQEPCELPREIQILDGLQRLTAVRAYVRGEIQPFEVTKEDMDANGFHANRVAYRLRFQVLTFRARKELLQYYLDMNAGGVVHSDSEIERVRGLLAAAEEQK